MIRSRLFGRFALRFFAGIGLALVLFIPLVHLFQLRTVNQEWREDLKQEATWFARHFFMTEPDVIANAWGQMHSATRVVFFDSEGDFVADSHPDRERPDLEALLAGGGAGSSLAVVEELKVGGWVVMSRPAVPAFPRGLQWELVVAAVLVVGLALLLLYPLVRSLTSTLGQLGELAGEVSAGQFGKTLAIERGDELGDLVKSFNDMSARLAEAERVNTRLFHDVSHELRSPLGRIQALAQTVALHPEDSTSCLRGIEQEIGLLDRLVDDLLQAARLESEDGLRFETFSLQHWAGEFLPRLASVVRARGIDWTAELPYEDREVRGDPQRLAQAVGNLVDNATHALDGRSDAWIGVQLGLNGKAWSIAVEDNGPGIPEQDRAHVFRRFYRVDEHRGQGHGGVGLGLSLVHSIAAAHGGNASIAGRDEGGVRVAIELPVDRV